MPFFGKPSSNWRRASEFVLQQNIIIRLNDLFYRKDVRYSMIFVNVIATPLLASSASEDTEKATAKQAESKLHEAAALIVAETTLIPALSNFIEGLTRAAGFFQVVETEIQSCAEKVEKNMESPKRLHYKRVSIEAKDIRSLCQASPPYCRPFAPTSRQFQTKAPTKTTLTGGWRSN